MGTGVEVNAYWLLEMKRFPGATGVSHVKDRPAASQHT